MIHASVARLAKHNDDMNFNRVMAEIEAAQIEGLESFEIDVASINEDARLDLSVALGYLGYLTDYDEDSETVQISYE